MKYYLLILLTSLMLITPGNVRSQVVCQVSDLDGQALLIPKNGNRHELTEFEKIESGGQVNLSQGAKLRLCFLSNGRIEEWVGPAELIIEDHATSEVLNKNKPVIKEYTELKTVLSESIALRNQKELIAGQVTVRKPIIDAKLSLKEQEELDKNEQLFNMLKSQFPAGDHTADIFHLAYLEHFGQKASMYKNINKLLRSEKDNQALMEMLKGI